MKIMPVKKSADKPVMDRGEQPALMEPMIIPEDSPRRAGLADLALELAKRSAGFRRSLPTGLTATLATLVRSMNCYYSNLIEGHDTHPIDIERALKDDYSRDPRKRDLQREATAHIAVQKWIDEGGLVSRATSVEGVLEIHRRFYEFLPEDLLWLQDPATGERTHIEPGRLREREVAVGQHVAISPGAVSRFLNRFGEVYQRLGKAELVIACAAAHHRLAWIHPFLDGNGRVARLMSHAILLETVDSGALWSVARGLARNVAAYKAHMANCDLPRRNDLDGRGNLSEEMLASFTRFFLETSIDQVAFMETLMQPDRLRARILLWAEEEIRMGSLPAKCGQVLEAVLYRGELPRGEVAGLIGSQERQARRVVASLVRAGVLTSLTPKASLRLAFPAALAGRWMPGLFPERTS